MADIGVIIPTLKPRREVVCLDSLDDNSFSDFNVYLQDEPTATAARNAGIERATEDKLVFLDDDSRPRSGYLARMSRVLEEESAVAGRTVHPRDDIFRASFTSHYDFGDTPRYVTRFWGCNMAVHRDVFEAVGLWDEGIGWGHEEIELAERVLTVAPIYYDPDLVVDHPYADSVPDYLRKVYRLETSTPYLWEKQGYSRREQWLEIGKHGLNPVSYIGRSLPSTLVRTAGTLARMAGQFSGMQRRTRTTEGDAEPDGSVPRISDSSGTD